MPLSFRILPKFGLVHVRLTDRVTPHEIMRSLQAYGIHPDFRRDHKHLVDLGAITGYDRDYVGMMRMLAMIGELSTGGPTETLMCCLAPHRIARSMALLAVRSWNGNPGMIVRIAETEAEAFEVLGLPGTRLEDLLEPASPTQARRPG